MDARKKTILEVIILFIIIIGSCTVWALNSFGVINLCNCKQETCNCTSDTCEKKDDENNVTSNE